MSDVKVTMTTTTAPIPLTEGAQTVSNKFPEEKKKSLASGTDSSIDSDYSFDCDGRPNNSSLSSSSSHSTPTHIISHPPSYGSHPICGAVTSTPLLQQKSGKTRASSSSVPHSATSKSQTILGKDIKGRTSSTSSSGPQQEGNMSRETSLENIASSDSSSQEPDSAHLTEESHSSVDTSEDQDADTNYSCKRGQPYQSTGIRFVSTKSRVLILTFRIILESLYLSFYII